jgi:hypothetical protein
MGSWLYFRDPTSSMIRSLLWVPRRERAERTVFTRIALGLRVCLNDEQLNTAFQ